MYHREKLWHTQEVLHLPEGGCDRFFFFVSIVCQVRIVLLLRFTELKSRHLDADAALQFELQTDHVHLAGGAQLFDLSHLLAHLVDGNLDGAQISMVLIHHRDPFLYIRKAMSGWRRENTMRLVVNSEYR